MDMGRTSSMVGLACVTTGFLSLRLYSRHLIKQRFWWDDWLIVFSLACNMAVLGLNIAMLSQVRHITTTTNPPLASQMVMPYKLLLASDVMYASSLSLTKLSALLMQYRIFDIARGFRRWVWLVGAFLVGWWVAVFFLLLFACWPVQKRWDSSIPGHCLSRNPGAIANSVATIVGNVMVLVLPIPQIWKLQLRRMEKVLLTMIFGLGICIICTSVVRLVVFVRNEETPTDLWSSMVAVVGWSDVEMSTGIICACLPALRPIIVRISKARARVCSCLRRNKPQRDSHNNSTIKNTSNSSSSAAPSKSSACRHSSMSKASACHVCRQTSHERLYYGVDHDLDSILSMDDELCSGDVAMTTMPFKHEFKHQVEPGTAV
ncbi:hypothetical protein PISL3812_07014 [Talaromyces islandicus]|uniref:Rhodopsin domain-containing protein n=1 Tax=Talaromyces islandicus TaxID=28573 RepID=A0A0U1M379_TALIS|nr:hypothetical protein PISL3812_07014 [Talaromyces islandicus]